MNDHMDQSEYPMRDHRGQSDPRDNRYRRERMDGFLNQFGTPDDFSQERHHDVSPPRDTYDRLFLGMMVDLVVLQGRLNMHVPGPTLTIVRIDLQTAQTARKLLHGLILERTVVLV